MQKLWWLCQNLPLQFLHTMWIDGSMMLCRFKSQLSDFTNSGSEPTVWGHASTGGNASSGTTLPFARICCRKWMRCSSIAAETAIIVPWIPWVWIKASFLDGAALSQLYEPNKSPVQHLAVGYQHTCKRKVLNSIQIAILVIVGSSVKPCETVKRWHEFITSYALMPLAPLHRHEHDALNREVRGLQGISGSLQGVSRHFARLLKTGILMHLASSCIVLWLCPHFGTPFSVRFTFFILFSPICVRSAEAWWSVMKCDEAWWSATIRSTSVITMKNWSFLPKIPRVQDTWIERRWIYCMKATAIAATKATKATRACQACAVTRCDTFGSVWCSKPALKLLEAMVLAMLKKRRRHVGHDRFFEFVMFCVRLRSNIDNQ